MMRYLPATLLLLLPAALAGQQPAETDTATPGPRYSAGGFHKFLFGASYRELWTTPVSVEVLDLATEAGGLTPAGTGGGQQTLNLRFRGADGRPYTFRNLDKDPTGVLPEELRTSFAVDLVQDQTHAAFPTAGPVVERLLEAVGLWGRGSRLVILPDSPLLGEYRSRFAGRIGTFEEWANEGPDGAEGFAGATEVVSTDELYDILLQDPRERVDLETFLTARIFDVYIGDWDRHKDQWRWGNVGPAEPGEPPSWTPFPEDRDQAFARYDGILLSVGRVKAPQLTKFGKKYSPIEGATWNGRELDRALLTMIELPAWDSIADWMQQQLTDEVIERSVAELPQSHFELIGDELAEALRVRRDDLPQMARDYFRYLNYQADFHLRDTPDYAVVEYQDDGSMVLSARSGTANPYQTRSFSPETREVRLFLHGGQDTVVVRGSRDQKIILRVISERGFNTVIDSTGRGRAKVYDDRGDSLTVAGAKVDRKSYEEPQQSPNTIPPRSWGSHTFPIGWAGFNPDLGPYLVAGLVHQRFGFRKDPLAQDHRGTVTIGFKKLGARLEYEGLIYQENSRNRWVFQALASGIEINNFYGFGNDTPAAANRDFNKVDQNDFQARAEFQLGIGQALRIGFGGMGRFTTTSERNDLVNVLKPYGFEDFAFVGGTAMLELETRDQPVAPRTGVVARLRGTVVPEIMSVDSGAFGNLDGIVEANVTPRGWPLTFTARGGARKNFGTTPFTESAFLGGAGTLRGYRDQRFAGDEAAWFNAEARLRLGQLFLLVPNNFGLFGLFDGGRVWQDGVSQGDINTSWGGGFWLAPLRNPSNTAVIGMARGETTLVYLRLGFGI